MAGGDERKPDNGRITPGGEGEARAGGDGAGATGDPAHEKTVEEARTRILKCLGKHSLSRGQLYEVVRGTKQIFNEALDALKTSGIVTGDPRGRSVLYRVTEIPK